MMKTPFVLALSIVVIRVSCDDYCARTPGKWQQMNVTRGCCALATEQLELIAWYFERVSSYIKVTEVVPEERVEQQSKFMSYLLKDLFAYTGVEYQTFRVNYSHRDQLLDKDEPYTSTYRWHAELSKGANRAHYIEVKDTESTFRQRISLKGRPREDDPDFGSVVLAETIEILDYYLNGETRHPFKSKRAHYVLIVYRETDRNTWDSWASSVMSKLWKNHGILNAIVVSTCKEKNFGYYDPFVNVGQFNLSNVDEWGIFHCMPISSMDFNDNWLVQKEYSLNNFPLVFTIFERYPTMVKNLPPYFADTFYNGGMKFSGYGGIDGLLLGNLAQELQFEVETIEPSDDKTYGHKKKTGTFTGTIADILYGDADAAFNGRFFLEYGTRKIEFLLPVLGDKVCIIAPGAEKIPQWIAIFKCFDVYFWCTFAIITLLSSLCFFVLKVWQEKHEMAIIRQSLLYQEFKQHVVEDEGNFKDIFFITWKVMVGITANMPFGSMERLFIGSCLLANLIISGTFESSLYTAYTKRSYYKNIDTLADLDGSNFKISTSSPSLRNLFGNNQTPSDVLQSLKGKFFRGNGIDPLERTAYRRDACSIERHSDVNIIIQTKFLYPDGSPKLHVIKECPRHYFLTYIVRRGWPFLPRFNMVMTRLAEAGLVELWYRATEDAFILNKTIQNMKLGQDLEANRRKPFSLRDIQSAFYFLIIGYIISAIVFLIEKFVMPPERFNRFIRSRRDGKWKISKKQRKRKIQMKKKLKKETY